ncbi:MAG: NAD(P)-dependent oxidoreductase, partial [Cyclobacteriaceae bacterium]
IVRSKIFIDEPFLALAHNLEFIGRAGAGIDNIDEAVVKSNKIRIFNAPEGNRDAVGEHAIGMLLMLFNNLYRAHTEVAGGQWRREANRGIELSEKTVGILGYGNTGRSLAQKLQGFGCRIVAYDKYKSAFAEPFVKKVSLEEFYENVDVLSIHIPLTAETLGYIDRRFFEAFERDIFVINTSRGKVLKLTDLLQAIDSGKVIGACLDVLENEKPAEFSKEEKEVFDKLQNSDKVLFSPHVAGWTFESYRKISEVLAEKIIKHYLHQHRIV